MMPKSKVKAVPIEIKTDGFIILNSAEGLWSKTIFWNRQDCIKRLDSVLGLGGYNIDKFSILEAIVIIRPIKKGKK